MKSIIKYSLVFSLGLILGLYFLWRTKNDYKTKQIDIISNGLKNVSKLIVTEENFTEIYNYQDIDKYLFETFEFKKKVILLISAKVQVSYDLKKLDIKIDTLKNQIVINKIPNEEIEIIPTYKYYDFQQSIWNTFTKEELNTIQSNSLEKLITNVKIAKAKNTAKKQLFKELNNLLQITELVNWTLVDNTQEKILDNVLNLEFKN